jgi:large subunit ribosomal protein L29
MTRAVELAGMDPGELEQRLAESRRELLNLRFQAATGQLDNTARLGVVRREVARILTVLREAELTGNEGFERRTPAEPAPARAPRLRRRSRAAEAEEEAGAAEQAVVDDEVAPAGTAEDEAAGPEDEEE